MKARTQVLSVLFAIVVVVLATQVPRAGVHRAAWANVCDLVVSKFYRDDQALQDWYRGCIESSQSVRWWWTRADVMHEIQSKLDELEVSHLNLFNPEEDRRLWQGEAPDTGLRLWAIDSRWVVARVLPGSVAAQAGIQVGEELLSIDGESIHSEWAAQTSHGKFGFQKGDKVYYVEMRPTVLHIDRAPELVALGNFTAWIEISSFRAEYFREKEWRYLISQLGNYKNLIIDLRDNAGGNIVSMLRALSPLMCSETTVGTLSQPRRQIERGPSPPDNLDDRTQLDFLEKYQSVPLQTFANYGCYRGDVTVLIDAGSASVSEIFAHAMLNRPRSRVWGRPSAGDVLIATWYFLPLLGPGYSLSIPEALFLTTKGESLEGGGVWPQVTLDYKLEEALAGRDSWLDRASGK